MPLQWRYQIWQSLEEGAGKRCWERDRWAKPAHNTPSLAFPASSPRSCPPTLQRCPKGSNMAPKHARKREARPPQVKKEEKGSVSSTAAQGSRRDQEEGGGAGPSS